MMGAGKVSTALFRVKDATVLGGVALTVPNTELSFHVVVKLNADPDRIYDASFGVMTPKVNSATVEEEWERLYVTDFGVLTSPTTVAWFGSNPAGADLLWGGWPY